MVLELLVLLEENRSKGVLRERVWPDRALLRGDSVRAALQQLQGLGSAFHGIPVAEHLAARALPDSQNPKQEARADL